ncbi:MAG TPA: hypothetical protein VK446_00110 [Methylocystis sp.]|nr:hypothetical protein [Methylocystis sp.]
MPKVIPSLLTLLCLGAVSSAAHAAPQPCGSRIAYVPTKTLKVYNNSETTLYMFLQSPEKSGSNVADLWMQSVCGVTDWTLNSGVYGSTRTFQTTRNYRAYIDTGFSDGGIPQHGWIEIAVPFYTQLKAVTAANLGKVPDQYIDWWNAARTYYFDSAAGFNSALWTNDLGISKEQGGGLPQPAVQILAGAAAPTCVAHAQDGSTKSCSINLTQVKINPPTGIPFQLQEYTFGSAEGPPLINNLQAPYRTSTGLEWVNYNVSSLDSVFLPVAMGPVDSTDPTGFPITGVKAEWVGSATSVQDFRDAIITFSNGGNNWPFLIPTYFDSKPHAGFPSSASYACSLAPFPSDYNYAAYDLPVVPGTFNVLTASWVGAPNSGAPYPPTPPVMSSNPGNWSTIPAYQDKQCNPPAPTPYVNPPALGLQGNQIVSLWRSCLNGGDTSQTCQYINAIVPLFQKSYTKSCPGKNPPWSFSGSGQNEVVPWQLMTAVYGWVPVFFNSCAGYDLGRTALANNIDFKALQENYCRLQYNYLGVPTQYIFNPYTKFIHGEFSQSTPALGSTAYAFSIDDALSFIHFPSTGVVIAIGGTQGLVNQTGAPIPLTEQEALQHCKAP